MKNLKWPDLLLIGVMVLGLTAFVQVFTTVNDPGSPLSDVSELEMALQTAEGARNPVGDYAYRFIVIHDTGTEQGSHAIFRDDPELLEPPHRAPDGDPHGPHIFHFLVGNVLGLDEGEVETTPRFRHRIPGRVLRMPGPTGVPMVGSTLDVAVVGDFATMDLHSVQRESLRNLVGRLMNDYRIPRRRVLYHGEIAGTEGGREMFPCPGPRFPRSAFRRSLSGPGDR